MSLPLITLYGVGVTVGAGIFVLIGKVVAAAGAYAPLSFLVAASLAAFTALSFAELSARFPRSAGEAVYVLEGLGSARLAAAVGLLVVAAGTVSAAAISQGFMGYFAEFVDTPARLTLLLVVLLLGTVAAWGITESVVAASLFTVLEIFALLLVIWGGRDAFAVFVERPTEVLPPLTGAVWLGVFAGATLAFYAFIGFEDMVNVAEEVKDVHRNLPLAIGLTLVITTLVYLGVSLVAVVAVPRAELAASKAPLALLYQRTTGAPPVLIGLIGMVAVINGALIQIIMGARVIYGMSALGWLPAWLGAVNRRTRTPLWATAFITGAVAMLGLWLPLVTLAQLTTAITLVIFALVNLALFRLKQRGGATAGGFTVPAWVPALGCLVSGGFVLYQFVRFLAS